MLFSFLFLSEFVLYMQYLYCIFNVKEMSLMQKRVTFTLDERLIERLRKVSKETMVPQSKLVEKSLTEVLNKYEKQNDRV